MADCLKKVNELSRHASVRTIDTFFNKKFKSETEAAGESSSTLQVPSTSHSDSDVHCFDAAGNRRERASSSSISESTHGNVPQHFQHAVSYDIGCYRRQSDIDDYTKAMLLERHWSPPSDYEFPYCVVTKNGKKLKKYAQRSHLEKFHWLVLSHEDQGLYCKYCTLFTVGSGGGFQTNTPLKRLVREPLKAFDDLLGDRGTLLTHQRNKYHQRAVEAGKNFLFSFHHPEHDVANRICSQRDAQVKENRERLRPIISSIIFCGRQNIALRGHRDDGNLYQRSSNAKTDAPHHERDNVMASSDGNFRAVLRFRVDSGDSNLRRHLENKSSNATYISKTTQNQLIDVCKEEIQDKILSRVREAKFFSIMFDETTDIAHIEQLSLSVCYLHEGIRREDFITFCNAYEEICPEDANEERRLTGFALAHIVKDLCKKFNIDLNMCVGIGTDSCSVMVSESKGAIQELIKTAVNAKHCPCSNHLLNNCLANSSKVTICRNASATMKKIVAFANASAKRHSVFKEALGGIALQGICETRWVERHDGHLQFQGDNLIKICDALHKISLWRDSTTASEAQCLRQALRSPEFILSTVCLCDVLGVTVSLSRFLQSTNIDVKRAMDAMKDTISVLEQKRKDVDSVFRQLFSEAQEVAEQLDVEMKAPRLVQRQVYRDNHLTAQTTEEYFRRALYIPLLENIISDVKERFSPNVMNVFNLRIFLPRTSYSGEDIEIVKEAAEAYKQLLGSSVSFVVQEFQLWVARWKRHVDAGHKIPESLFDIIEMCDSELYPSICTILKILATLPVSVATAERSFSTLRRLKTWLRTTMGEERLTGLALLHIHRDIDIDIDAVITRFAKMKNRRLEFVL